MITLYLLALVTLLLGTTGLYMTLIQAFPLKLIYYNSRFGRPLIMVIFAGSFLYWAGYLGTNLNLWALVPIAIMGLSLVFSYRMQQEAVFVAVDYPPAATDPLALPIEDDMQVAVIEYDGVTKAYPLDYVIHHHVVNDKFGERIVSLTYCAMCRTIIPFDVTDIGPLYVASFKNANMVLGDRKTRTFFQQATFESVIGKLHPHSLEMIPFQILAWGDVKKLAAMPAVVQVTEADFVPFELPIPGAWKRIMASEVTPGLKASNRDKTFPTRTPVVGIVDTVTETAVAYLKRDLLSAGSTHNPELHVYLIGVHDTVNAFADHLQGKALELTLTDDNTISDVTTGTVWDLRGKRISGDLTDDLEPVAFSDEYWFSWKQYHPETSVITA